MGSEFAFLLLLIKKILIAIVLIVITSNTLVQQIVKTIISQQTIELTPEGIMFPSIAPAIDNPYNLGVFFLVRRFKPITYAEI